MSSPQVMGSVLRVPIDKLAVHPRNVRRSVGDLDELVASIFAHGIIVPLIVTTTPDGWQLLAGHRRLAAAKRAGFASVPTIQVRSMDRVGQTATMLAENLMRAQLDPIEEAKAYETLRRSGLTIAAIAEATGVSVKRVTGRMILLDLPQEAREMVSDGDLTKAEGVDLARQIRTRPVGEVDQARCPVTFTRSHRLAGDASQRCAALAHPKRGRVGSVACGECWEQSIRDDERGVSPVTPPSAAPPSPTPNVAVRPRSQAFLDDVGWLADSGLTITQIAERISSTTGAIERRLLRYGAVDLWKRIRDRSPNVSVP